MKRIIQILFYFCVFVGGTIFIVRTFVRSSPSQQVAQPPSLAISPARLYGKIEPAGREVFVSSPISRKVVRIHSREGDRVKKGQKLLSLDNAVELVELEVALAKVDSFQKALAISQDNLRRRENLYAKNADTEYATTQARLKVDLDKSSLHQAEKEVGLVRARLDQLELKSPVEAILYKFDVRLGETLSAGENTKIVLGSEELWVRLSVESFWLHRIELGTQYKVYNSETNELVGTGEVIYKAPYLGRRDFRTEDQQERFDTKYLDVILKLQRAAKNIPLGLSVVAEISPSDSSPSR